MSLTSQGPVWDFASANPSWSCMAAACGLPLTLPEEQVFTSPYPAGAGRNGLRSLITALL